MAKNFIQRGNVLDFTAPAGGVIAGSGYIIGDLFIIALNTEKAGKSFSAQCAGVFKLPKLAGASFAEGAPVYWDSDNSQAIETQAASEPLIGHTTLTAGPEDESVVVRLIPTFEVTDNE